MSLGIAVEFCAHVLHAFGVAHGTRPARMAAALERTGASVMSGGSSRHAMSAANHTFMHVEMCFCSCLLSCSSSLLMCMESLHAGITLTKLVGVAVLGFAQTQIFEIYYFR